MAFQVPYFLPTEYVSRSLYSSAKSPVLHAINLHLHLHSIRLSAAESNRRAIKSLNTYGDPIQLNAQLLAIIEDPICPYGVYIAEITGNVRRITLDVCLFYLSLTLSQKTLTLSWTTCADFK